MQKAAVVLIIVMINLLFLQSCPVMAKQEEPAVVSPPAPSSSVKLKKFLTLALLLSEGKHSRKKGVHYFLQPSRKINKKTTPP